MNARILASKNNSGPGEIQLVFQDPLVPGGDQLLRCFPDLDTVLDRSGPDLLRHPDDVVLFDELVNRDAVQLHVPLRHPDLVDALDLLDNRAVTVLHEVELGINAPQPRDSLVGVL